MAFMRSSTSKSMLSQAWSTGEIAEGLAHLMTDGRLELPDDAAQLQAGLRDGFVCLRFS